MLWLFIDDIMIHCGEPEADSPENSDVVAIGFNLNTMGSIMPPRTHVFYLFCLFRFE